LQDEACIAESDHFGLHDIRRSAARVLWQTDPEAARLALGHTSLDVTASYYVAHETIAKPALANMPQPWGGGADDNEEEKPAG